MLDIKVVLTGEKKLDKKALLNSYEDSFFLIINSDNQELIHHIHCIEYKLSSKQDNEILQIS